MRENWFPFLFPWKYVLIRQFQRDLGKKLTTICGCSINFLANDYLPIYGIAPLVKKNILNYYEQMHEKHILTRFYLDNWEITWLLGKSWFWIFWNKKKWIGTKTWQKVSNQNSNSGFFFTHITSVFPWLPLNRNLSLRYTWRHNENIYI